MYSALIKNLGSLPDSTRVFCGHEYSMQNLKFAQHVEKDNTDITEKMNWVKELRAKNQPTVKQTYLKIVSNFIKIIM